MKLKFNTGRELTKLEGLSHEKNRWTSQNTERV